MIRDRTCLDCGAHWTSPVRLTPHTYNLSGEETEWCAECNGRNVMSGPARQYASCDTSGVMP